jgi:hypothetical protein
MRRVYHHIVGLGLNCEPGFVLEDMYGRLDSYPLSWALVPDVPNLLLALEDMDLLFGEGYTVVPGSFDMFLCWRTGIRFHGKSDLRAGNYAPELVEEAFAELAGRMEYLCGKFRRVLQSGREVLCIVKNHNRGGSRRGFTTREALDIKAALDGMSVGKKPDLLCVDRRGCEPPAFDPGCEERGVYKRLLEGFAPGERAYLYDTPGWARIFAEFDSVHSCAAGAERGERARELELHLGERRAARLRDIRERTPGEEGVCR